MLCLKLQNLFRFLRSKPIGRVERSSINFHYSRDKIYSKNSTVSFRTITTYTHTHTHTRASLFQCPASALFATGKKVGMVGRGGERRSPAIRGIKPRWTPNVSILSTASFRGTTKYNHEIRSCEYL